MSNWKTTVQGILSGTIAFTISLLSLNILPPKYAAVATAVQGLAKAILGMYQHDAVATPPATK